MHCGTDGSTMLNCEFSSGLQVARSTNKSLQGVSVCVHGRERERERVISEVQPIYARGRFSYRSILVNWEDVPFPGLSNCAKIRFGKIANLFNWQ